MALSINKQDLDAIQHLPLPNILPQDREDCLQDALETACHTFDPNRGELKSYVHKVAYNKCLNHARTYRHRVVELDAGDIPDPKSNISEPAEQPEWLEKTLKRCELLTMSPKPGMRSMAADTIVALRRLKELADADDLDSIHSKALWEGPLHDAVVASGHPISTKSMWDLARFVRSEVKRSL